jgi:hypothetical protein
MKSLIIVVDYEEHKPETYKGVSLYMDGREILRSTVGYFEIDYEVICQSATPTLEKLLGTDRVYVSSSVDNWYMDNDK